MSTIPTKHIEGDVAVGRNVSAGGDVNIQGDGRIGHNLTVGGWLNARNISGPYKGMYVTVSKLHEEYPEPQNGWYALVGRKLPAALMVCDDGKWIYTGENVSNLDVAESDTGLAQSLATLRTLVENLNDSKGEPGGIAPLNENGQVPGDYLPTSITNEVVEYAHAVSGVTTVAGTTARKTSSSAGCKVVYDSVKKRFLLAETETDASTGLTQAPKYYTNWIDGDRYGTSSSTGRTPVCGKIYIDRSENIPYRWNDEKLTLAALASTSQGGTTTDRDDQSESAENKKKIEGIGILPFDGINDPNSGHATPIDGVWYMPSAGCFKYYKSAYGWSESDYNTTTGATKTARADKIYRCGTKLYYYADGILNELGSTAENNVINVSVEYPKTDGTYYDLETAIATVYTNNRSKLGMQIIFAASATVCKQYRYIGTTLDKSDVCDTAKWADMTSTDYDKDAEITYRDRGTWDKYSTYLCAQSILASSKNVRGGKYTDDVWHHGCRYRNLKVNNVGSEPKYGNPDWRMIEGDPQFYLDFYNLPHICNVDPDNFSIDLILKGKIYNQDVTDLITASNVVWERYSEDAQGTPRDTEDKIWNSKHQSAGKSLTITQDDCGLDGYIPKVVRFTATATLEEGMVKAISYEL